MPRSIPKQFSKYEDSGLHHILNDVLQKLHERYPKYQDNPFLVLSHQYILNLITTLHEKILPLFSGGNNPGILELKKCLELRQIIQEYNSAYEKLLKIDPSLENNGEHGFWSYDILMVFLNASRQVALDINGVFSFLDPKAFTYDLHHGWVIAPMIRRMFHGISGLIQHQSDSSLPFHFNVILFKNNHHFLNLSFDFATLFAGIESYLAHQIYQHQLEINPFGNRYRTCSVAYKEVVDLQKSTITQEMQRLHAKVQAWSDIDDLQQLSLDIQSLEVKFDDFKQKPLREYLSPARVMVLSGFLGLDQPLPDALPGYELMDLEYYSIMKQLEDFFRLLSAILHKQDAFPWVVQLEFGEVFKDFLPQLESYLPFLQRFFGRQRASSFAALLRYSFQSKECMTIDLHASSPEEGFKDLPERYRRLLPLGAQVSPMAADAKAELKKYQIWVMEKITARQAPLSHEDGHQLDAIFTFFKPAIEEHKQAPSPLMQERVHHLSG